MPYARLSMANIKHEADAEALKEQTTSVLY